MNDFLVIVKCEWSGEQFTAKPIPLPNGNYNIKILWEVDGKRFWDNNFRKSQSYKVIGKILPKKTHN